MIEVDLALCDIVAFADPAGSKTEVKKVQARSALAVLAGDAYDRIFVLKAWAQRTSTDSFVAEIFNTFDEFPQLRVFGVEANAMQSLFADMLTREARLRGARRYPFVKVTQPTRLEKPFRNRSALQTDINGGWFLMEEGGQVEAYNELETHPMCSQFDLVDSMASARALLRRTSRDEARAADHSQTRRYLKKTGVPDDIADAYLVAREHAMEPVIPPRPTISRP